MTNYLTKRSLIIAVVLTVGIFVGSVGWYVNTSSADLTDQEVYRIIKNWHDDNGHLFVSQEELAAAHEVINAAIAAPHTNYADVNHNHNQYAVQSHSHTTTIIPRSINFDLEVCHDYRCDDDRNRFNQGDVLYLIGSHNTNDKMLDFEIRDSNDIKIDSGQTSMTLGNFLWQWSIPNNLDDDIYTITIEIDRNEDEIIFIVS